LKLARQVSQVHSHISGKAVRPFRDFNPREYQALSKIGIHLSPRDVRQMQMASADSQETGMDALQYPSTTPSITNPIQFLQNWLPGFVNIITQARRIDMIIGITTAGDWEDEEIVQGELENLGTAVPYGDTTNIPLSDWNANWNTRTVVRFEEGMAVGLLEEARSAKIKVNSSDQKRVSATLALEIQRNRIGFFGYNNGLNYTFGFLNDPNATAYVEFANGATSGSPAWATKTFMDITADFRTMFSALRTQSGDNVDPKMVDITVAVATAVVDYLTIPPVYGAGSVLSWLQDNYPRVRIVSAPELDAANAGDNVCIMFADSVSDDASTDDGKTWLQVVPAKFKVLGVEQKAKGYMEDYSNATAGAMLKRPYAMVRYYGC
jgi:hypothetical protein